jgi:L,D-peptidoglycan transpeptidase YkuD (ErfK/YbiS/YcfS/YnhG family)
MNKISVFSSGKLIWKNKEYKCALGRSGVSDNKIEDDQKTPLGCFFLRKVLFRPDKIKQPETALAIEPLNPDDGWCHNPKDKNYNQFVKLPYPACAGRPAGAEKLWREDNLYDIIVVLGYNDNPVIPEKGSAIFMHIAGENYPPTDGCLALSLSDLLEILKTVNKKTLICIKK